MAHDKVRDVLRSAARDPETLRQLREDPGGLRERFGLDEREVAALDRADVLVVGTIPGGLLQTTSPITITVTTHRAFDSGDPPFSFPLEDMDSDRLAAVLQRVLVDPGFAARVRRQVEL